MSQESTFLLSMKKMSLRSRVVLKMKWTTFKNMNFSVGETIQVNPNRLLI